MSSQIYPSLPGLGFDVVRSYVWKSGNQEALSGKQTAIAYRSYPLVHYELTYNVLRDVGAAAFSGGTSEIQTIAGLHNQMRGRWDTFLFTDPDFNTITISTASQYGVFGEGDGSTLIFQLVATYEATVSGPGAPELIQNLNGTPVLYDNGTIISAANYSIGATGIVTFGAGHAPAAGHFLTWTGSWYYRCRFDEDAIIYKKFMNKLWATEVKFTSVKL